MIQVLSEGLVVLYLTNLFVLGIVYASPYLQTTFKVSSRDVFNAILVTILYTLSLVALFCVVKKLGISESKLLYTFDGLLWFYLVCLYGWFVLRERRINERFRIDCILVAISTNKFCRSKDFRV